MINLYLIFLKTSGATVNEQIITETTPIAIGISVNRSFFSSKSLMKYLANFNLLNRFI